MWNRIYIWVFLHFVGGFGVGGGVKWEWIDSAVHELVCFVFLFGKEQDDFYDFFSSELFVYLSLSDYRMNNMVKLETKNLPFFCGYVEDEWKNVRYEECD